jgi:hypothetical protein
MRVERHTGGVRQSCGLTLGQRTLVSIPEAGVYQAVYDRGILDWGVTNCTSTHRYTIPHTAQASVPVHNTRKQDGGLHTIVTRLSLF